MKIESPDLTTSTPEQRRAVLSVAPVICAIAGPGSGKTKTLTDRILHLLANGTDPLRICVVTFTNSGAIALTERLGGVKLAYVGTLHGFMLDGLQKHGGHLGYDERITVLELDKSRDVAAKGAKLKPATEILEAVRAACCPSVKLGMLINFRSDPARVRALASVSANMAGKMEIAVKEYAKRMRAEGCADFDTILSDGLKIAHLVDRIEHLFVDEAQDSGDLDFAIYNALPVVNRFVVGDFDQGVYKFRGGNPEHLLRLAADPSVDVCKLETNFRSDVSICEAAQRLIEHNTGRIAKRTIPFSNEPGDVSVQGYQSAEEEVAAIIAWCRACIGDIPSVVRESGTLAASLEIAVLTRNNAEAQAIATALKNAGLPVREREQNVEDTNRHLRAAVQMLNAPSDAAVIEFLRFDQPVWRLDAWKSEARLKGQPIRKLCNDKRVPAQPCGALWNGALLDALARIGLNKAEIEAARDAMATIATPSLGTLALALRPGDAKEVGEGITVTTFHGSKGREFDNVWLAACEDAIIPGKRTSTDVEEERRLFFVAMTRARHRLKVSWSLLRPAEWGDPFTEHVVSRFAGEACK